jgi:aryl-alcohol dehydrogenase-like predicted oxidoreductase
MFSPWHPATIDGDDVRAAVAKIAKRHHATPKQVALAWHLHASPFSVPIPGTTSIDHFDENLAAAQVELAPDEVESLTALRPPPEHQRMSPEGQRI